MIVKGTEEHEYEPIPTGIIKAILVNIIDIGLQPGFQGGKPQHKIVLVWELEPLMQDGKHFLVTKKYTASIGDKAILRKDLKSWRGKDFEPEDLAGFDLEKMVHKPCQLNLIESGKWVNVDSVLPASKDAYWSPVTGRDYIPAFVQRWIDEQLVTAPTEKDIQEQEDKLKNVDPGIF